MSISSLAWDLNTAAFGIAGNKDYPLWEMVEQKLQEILPNAGTVTLDTEDQNKLHRSLQVRAENGNYLMTLGVDTGEDWMVRTFSQPDQQVSNEMIEILGDIWLAKIVCHEKQVVTDIFKEFYETGDVSIKYLS